MSQDTQGVTLFTGFPHANSRSPKGGYLMSAQSDRKWILAATSLGLFVVLMDVSVVNIALKSIEGAFHSDIQGLQWVVNSYTLLFAAFLLTAGSVTDRFGAKRTFAAGFGLFTLMSIACATAQSFHALVISRAAQGLGAAIIVPASLSLLHASYHDHKERAGAVGIWAGAGSLALAAGPVLGGFLIVHFGWRSIFYINLPVGLLGIWLTLQHAPKDQSAGGRGVDLPGQIAAIVAIGGLTAAITRAGGTSLTERGVLAEFSFAVLAAIVFLLVEQKSSHPMVPLSLFSDSSFSVASAVGLAVNFVFYGMLFLLSLFFQTVQSYSALAAGLAFLPITVVIMLTNIVSGRLNGTLGPKKVITAGLIFAAVGYGWLATITAQSPYRSLLVQLLVAGIGIALTIPSLTVVSLSTAKGTSTGIVSAVFNTARQVGGLLGVAVLGSLVSNRQGEAFVAGFHTATWITAAILTGSLLLSIVFIRSKAQAVPEELVEEIAMV
jgi:MFS transporter, DHA2 family, methylenomycin A resistance protein